VRTALTSAFVALWPHVDAPSGEVWQQFEQQQVLSSLQSVRTTVRFNGSLRTFSSIVLFMFGIGDFSQMLGTTCFFIVIMLVNRMDQLGPIGAQCLSFTLLTMSTLIACTSGDTLVAHRAFCCRYSIDMTFFIFNAYLPFRWFSVFVTCQCSVSWLAFHWIMGFWSPFIVVQGLFLIPITSMAVFSRTQKQHWEVFCCAEKEKGARLRSEALKETLLGVLSVTFDASVECDTSGLVLSSSRHLQRFLGSETWDFAGCNLAELAADPTEAQRVGTFLRQMIVQKQDTAPRAVSPVAVLETVLSCGATWDAKDGKLKVKLCCASLPADFTDAAIGSHQRLFVGLQEVPVDSDRGASGSEGDSGASGGKGKAGKRDERAPNQGPSHARRPPALPQSAASLQKQRRPVDDESASEDEDSVDDFPSLGVNELPLQPTDVAISPLRESALLSASVAKPLQHAVFEIDSASSVSFLSEQEPLPSAASDLRLASIHESRQNQTDAVCDHESRLLDTVSETNTSSIHSQSHAAVQSGSDPRCGHA